MSTWRSPFELDLGDVSPDKVLQRARDRRWRLQGLRVRVRDGHIRARYVLGNGADASLLVARPVQRGSRTLLVGEMRWGALFASLLLRGIIPALFGVALLVWGLIDRTWQVIAIGTVLTLVLGWFSIDGLMHVSRDQSGEEHILRESLRDVLGSN